jgi:hypothetical protein
MLCHRKTKRSFLIVLMAAAVLASGFAVTAWAKKPDKPPGGGGGPVGTGTIYYSSDGYVRSMNPDGSGETLLFAWGEYSIGDASMLRHPAEAERCFLTIMPIEGETYPDGLQRHEVFAVSESRVEVQLTDDPGVQIWSPNGYPRPGLRWAADGGLADGKVTYFAQRWGKDAENNDIVVESGLFVVEVDWDEQGLPYYLSTPLKLPVSMPLGDHPPYYNWSPDGTQIVYSAGGVWLVDDSSNGPGIRLCDGYGARWSPVLADGTSLIAFQLGSWGSAEIRTISPDGSSETTIVTVGKNRTIWSGNGIFWSPEGTHLIYTLIQSKGCAACQYNDSYDVYRVEADGSNATNLTKDVQENCFSVNWRD